jgi:hypothetical protein
MTSDEFAELLDEPMRRVLGLSGGVLEVAIEEDESGVDDLPGDK